MTCSTGRSSAGIRSGRRVLGEAEVISSIPVPDIDAYHQARYTGANIVVAAAGNVEHEKIVELARRHVEPPTAGRDRRSAGTPRRSTAPRSASSRRTPSSSTSASGDPGSTAATSAATRSASSTPCSAARPHRGSSARFARRRASPTPSARTPSSTSTAGMIGIYVGTRGDNVPGGLRDHRPRARLDPYRRHHRRRAHPCEGARQRTDGPFLGVDRCPDGADRQVAPLRHPSSDARRDCSRRSTRSAPRTSPSSPASSIRRIRSPRPPSRRARTASATLAP